MARQASKHVFSQWQISCIPLLQNHFSSLRLRSTCKPRSLYETPTTKYSTFFTVSWEFSPRHQDGEKKGMEKQLINITDYLGKIPPSPFDLRAVGNDKILFCKPKAIEYIPGLGCQNLAIQITIIVWISSEKKTYTDSTEERKAELLLSLQGSVQPSRWQPLSERHR